MEDNYGCLGMIICVILIFFVVIGFNSCTESDWNNGECTKCEVRYELRAVSRGMKYYACPDCGKEVKRY